MLAEISQDSGVNQAFPWLLPTIDVVVLAIMVIGLVGMFFERGGHKPPRGIGRRSIQFVAVVFLFPTIIILGIHQILKADLLGTLIGTIVGYILSSFSDEKKADDNEADATSTPRPPGRTGSP